MPAAVRREQADCCISCLMLKYHRLTFPATIVSEAMLRNRIYNLIFVAICAAPLAGMAVYTAEESAGNESAAEWPSLLSGDGTLNPLYLSEIGDYVEDHFAFRSELITLNSVLRTSLLNTSTDEDVIAGTDNWLYYAATLDDYQHMNSVSERVLFNEAHNIALVQEWAEAAGKTFVFTIAPNKNTLYPDHMPSSLDITFAGESDLERLSVYLAAEDVSYVDMVSLFEAQEEVLYYERDSHWTETGAVLAYNALLDAAGIDHETYEDTQPVITTDYYGDLSEMIYPSGMYPEDYEQYLSDPSFEYVEAYSSGVSYLEEYRTAWLEEAAADAEEASAAAAAASGVPASFIDDASILVEQDTVTTYNEDGSGSLYMYRDSFGNSLLPYMAETFESAVFSEIVPWDLTSQEVQDADVIIMEKVERHLPTLSGIAPIMPALEQNLTFSYTSGEVIGSDEEYMEYLITAQIPEGGAGSEIVDVSDADLTQGTLEMNDTTDGNYLEISGTVSEDVCAVNGRIYAAVTDDDGTAVYEAFCVDTSDSDYGYTLYLTKDEIAGDIRNIRIVVRSGSVWTSVYEYRSAAYEQSRATIEEQAKELLETYGAEDPELAWIRYQAVQESAAEENEDTEDSEGMEGSEAGGNSGTDAVDADGSAQEASEESKEADLSTVVVSKRYIEDCGLDSGYWEITYADGHQEYIDD